MNLSTKTAMKMKSSIDQDGTHSKHIVPLDFNNVPKLPDSHAWAASPWVDPFARQALPVIDLSKPKPGLFDLLRHACEEWGAFQVINHGVPVSLLDETECQTRRLFSLPAERKMLAVRSPGGIAGYGLARISPFFPKLMWSEGFSIIGSPAQHASQLWPDEEEDRANFCSVMEQYQEGMKGLSQELLALMLGSLGLTHEGEEYMKWFEPENRIDQATGALQLNSYPVCPDPGRAMGLAPHTDSSLLTLLYQADVGGLQVHRDDAGWVPVEPLEGALVVNMGDLMHIVSNGRFKSVLHRAVVNNTRHRVSLAYFYGPPKNAKLSPLRKLVDRDHPPLYRPVTWNEYLDAKSKHFSKALESIRL